MLVLLGDSASSLLIDCLCHPADHVIPKRFKSNYDQYFDPDDWKVNKIASILAGVFVEQNPDEQSTNAIIERLNMIFTNPKGAREKVRDHHFYPELYYFPKARHCLSLLCKRPLTEKLSEYLLNVFSGQFNQHFKVSDYDEDEDEEEYSIDNSCRSLIGYEQAGFDLLYQFV